MENHLLTHLLVHLHDSLLVRHCISSPYLYLSLFLTLSPSKSRPGAWTRTCGGRDGEGSPRWTDRYNIYSKTD